MELDKITAMAAPPGHSLTDTPGKWAWEKPPQFANPDDALDFVLDKLEDPMTRKDTMRMMVAGISVQEIVSQIAFKGFMQGYYSPDVAELIKPSIGVYLYKEALEEGFEPRMMSDDKEEEGIREGEVDDVSFFKIMKERNPDLFEAMNEEINRQERMEIEGLEQDERTPVEMPTQDVPANSFLAMGDTRDG
tara:strand:+ start:1886 stop:2458 length:573 start_codon:yes stop_codon:yes gene_type:complete